MVKSHFGSPEIHILGHLVDKRGIQPDPDKVSAVTGFLAPTSTKDLQSFLGLCSYFRRFIRRFADILEPLTSLLRKDQPFRWGKGEEQAFQYLKQTLTSAPVLTHFTQRLPTEIHTDTSGYGMGAVLTQKQDSAEYVVSYASRKLAQAEQNYSTTERECLALVWAVSKFRPYIFGRSFSVVADHHSLCWLLAVKDPSRRLARWSLKLQQYDFIVPVEDTATQIACLGILGTVKLAV